MVTHKARLLEIKNLKRAVFTSCEEPLVVVLKADCRDVARMAFKIIFISELLWSEIVDLHYVVSCYS